MKRRRRRSTSERHGNSMLRGQEEEQKPMRDTEGRSEAQDENWSGLLLDGKFRLISKRLKSQGKKMFWILYQKVHWNVAVEYFQWSGRV